MNDQSGVRRPFLILSVAAFALGILALLVSWAVVPPAVSLEFGCLLLAVVISENYAIAMGGGYTFSLAYPLTAATLILCGPTNAAIVAISASTNFVDIRQKHWTVTAFNIGQFALCTTLAGWAYLALGGRVLLDTGNPFLPEEFPAALLPVLVTMLVMALGNVALACVGQATKSGVPLRTILDSVGWLPWAQVALGALGFMIAQVMAIHVAAFAFLIFPLLVARQFYERYTSLQSAFTDTIRSLVGALEAKDPYTRGHSERVAEYTLVLARAHGFDERQLNDLEKAALLHDLGKLALPGSLLRKQTKLTNEEWDAIKRHPVVGAEMVRRIPPLKKLADTVLGHHERLDGSGYPNGLHEQELSLNCRILAIADSYDAMTSDRPYRPGLSFEEATAELLRCSPSQLDLGLVHEFLGAIALDPSDVPGPIPAKMAKKTVEREGAA